MTERSNLPKGWHTIPISDSAQFINGRGFKKSEWSADGLPIIRIQNLKDPSKPFNYYSGEYSPDNYIENGDLLFSWSASLGIFQWNRGPALLNQHIFKVVPCTGINDNYLYYALQFVLKELTTHGSTMKHITKEVLDEQAILLPPLAVQERIVEVLQRADAIRRKRTEARLLADQILLAAFYGLFGDVDPISTEFDVVRLEEVADIRSGVTKGRKLEGNETVEVPYLRVANVQDGFLDVTEIKKITVLPTDVQKYHLEDGDILMTEGGDPDKLGRGCIWREQVKGCIHQNHIFRVRPDKTSILSEFLAALLRTSYAKGYFLRAAKRTSNLASINSTQVKAFSFPLPPMEMQRKFLLRVEQWDRAIGQSTDSLHLAERTFSALLSLAFTGELTAEWEAANADWIAERQTFHERLPRLALLSLLLERRQRTGGESVTLITALMKYAFLSQMEGELRRRLYRFVPYHYGPCAMELYKDLKALAAEGLITVENEAEEEKTRIMLSDPAHAAALLEEEARKDDVHIAALENVDEDAETAPDPTMLRLLKSRAEILEILRADAAAILDTYGKLDHNALLKKVYEKYPAYAKKSRVRKVRKSTSGK